MIEEVEDEIVKKYKGLSKKEIDQLIKSRL